MNTIKEIKNQINYKNDVKFIKALFKYYQENYQSKSAECFLLWIECIIFKVE